MKNLMQALVVLGLVNASPVLAHEGPIRSDVHVLLHLGFAATLLLAVGLSVVLWRMYYQRLRGLRTWHSLLTRYLPLASVPPMVGAQRWT